MVSLVRFKNNITILVIIISIGDVICQNVLFGKMCDKTGIHRQAKYLLAIPVVPKLVTAPFLNYGFSKGCPSLVITWLIIRNRKKNKNQKKKVMVGNVEINNNIMYRIKNNFYIFIYIMVIVSTAAIVGFSNKFLDHIQF